MLQDPASVVPGLRGPPAAGEPAGVRLPPQRGPRRAQGAPRPHRRQRVHVLGGGAAHRRHQAHLALGHSSQGERQTVRSLMQYLFISPAFIITLES